ncbi:MAG: YdcF family protein [Erysipelotrichales bacterium]|nr:YdcF family protein [Erysipelotrichales bacterium]
MKKRHYVLIAIGMALFCFLYIAVMGKTYTVKYNAPAGITSADQINVQFEVPGIAVLTEKKIEDGTLYLSFASVAEGRTFFEYDYGGLTSNGNYLYVHRFGIMTYGNIIGACTGCQVIPISLAAFLALVMIGLWKQYKAGIRENLYRYRNIRILGLFIFLVPIWVFLVTQVFNSQGLYGMIRFLLESANAFAYLAFPVAFIAFIIVTFSNLHLIIREGFNWRNALGALLGIAVCFCTFLPSMLYRWLEKVPYFDIHNMRSIGVFIDLAVESGVMVFLTYLECILAATIVLGIKAARHIPAFDKDYILVLGCQIKADGTPTKLLQGRIDRAMEFAKMQKEASGKDIVFVPSGGKGDDEIISEAACMANYLAEKGVDPSSILVEDKSVSTETNFRNSLELIQKHTDKKDPKIAFATTNFHVFRAGILATRLGIYAEGIGGKTKSYFWINAFVREFIATLYAERKTHILTILGMILLVATSAYAVYASYLV